MRLPNEAERRNKRRRPWITFWEGLVKKDPIKAGSEKKENEESMEFQKPEGLKVSGPDWLNITNTIEKQNKNGAVKRPSIYQY